MANLFASADPTPTDDLVSHSLGDSGEVWTRLMAILDELELDHPWRFYRDGGWLMKATRGKKTIAWVSIDDEPLLHLTCYFAARHRETLTHDELLPAGVRARIAETDMTGKTLPAPLDLRVLGDVETARRLIDLKRTLK